MIWYDMVWYGMVWYDMRWYGMVWCGMVWSTRRSVKKSGVSFVRLRSCPLPVLSHRPVHIDELVHVPTRDVEVVRQQASVRLRRLRVHQIKCRLFQLEEVLKVRHNAREIGLREPVVVRVHLPRLARRPVRVPASARGTGSI